MWEMLLLSVLKWEVSAITGHDFLWYIIKRLNLETPKPFVDVVIKHCGTFIGMCARGKSHQKIIIYILLQIMLAPVHAKHVTYNK